MEKTQEEHNVKITVQVLGFVFLGKVSATRKCHLMDRHNTEEITRMLSGGPRRVPQ